MRIRVLDLETCGEAPPAPVVEIAAWDLLWRPSDRLSTIGPVHDTLVDPGAPIPPLMSAIHHIIDEDVKGARPWDKAWPMFAGRLTEEVDAYCAHNAKFERQWITDEMIGGTPWICTYRCALRAWPEAPSHSNQALRYWLKPEGLSRLNAGNPHRAGGDAYVTAHILRRLLVEHPIETLIEWSGKPGLLPRVNFGKHRGMAWNVVPMDYLQWVARQDDMNEDVLFTAKHWLGVAYRRQGGRKRTEVEEPSAPPSRGLL